MPMMTNAPASEEEVAESGRAHILVGTAVAATAMGKGGLVDRPRGTSGVPLPAIHSTGEQCCAAGVGPLPHLHASYRRHPLSPKKKNMMLESPRNVGQPRAHLFTAPKGARGTKVPLLMIKLKMEGPNRPQDHRERAHITAPCSQSGSVAATRKPPISTTPGLSSSNSSVRWEETTTMPNASGRSPHRIPWT
jgi:hypothetical protein